MKNSPHHDGSDLYVSNSAPKIGDKITLKVRVPNDYLFEKAMLRIYHDGEPRIFEMKLSKKGTVESWYQVYVEIMNLQSISMLAASLTMMFTATMTFKSWLFQLIQHG
jgi:alpha-glucosidase